MSSPQSSLKATFQEVSSGPGRVLPNLPLQHQHLLDNPPLTSLELKNMGRETIAGLIAGILEKYSKKGEVSLIVGRVVVLVGVIVVRPVL